MKNTPKTHYTLQQFLDKQAAATEKLKGGLFEDKSESFYNLLVAMYLLEYLNPGSTERGFQHFIRLFPTEK